jgi:hypothetical protein
MAVTIDQVEARVEDIPPAPAAAQAAAPNKPPDTSEIRKTYIIIKERQLRLRAD